MPGLYPELAQSMDRPTDQTSESREAVTKTTPAPAAIGGPVIFRRRNPGKIRQRRGGPAASNRGSSAPPKAVKLLSQQSAQPIRNIKPQQHPRCWHPRPLPLPASVKRLRSPGQLIPSMQPPSGQPPDRETVCPHCPATCPSSPSPRTSSTPRLPSIPVAHFFLSEDGLSWQPIQAQWTGRARQCAPRFIPQPARSSQRQPKAATPLSVEL